MSRPIKYAEAKSGLGPGTLIHIGAVHHADARITVVDYGRDHFEQRAASSLLDTLQYRRKGSVTLVIVEGLAELKVVEEVGQHFNVHPLVLEDILNTHQRPKLEEHDDYLYIVLKSMAPSGEGSFVAYEQVSLLVLEGFILVFKEKADDLLQPLLQRLEHSRGRIRSQAADYLMYAVLDTIVDLSFGVMDQLEETLTALEEEIFTRPTPEVLGKIQKIRHEISKIRRYNSPIRDLLSGLIRSESGLICESTHIYLKDVHDHVLRIIESVETHREILSGLLEIYLSSISSRMNEVMKVLTVFATIFIPLTFLTGVYGMNFEFMPELKWAWAYPALWLVFITTSVVLLLYFRRKSWI
jgi:magnesium transporter